MLKKRIIFFEKIGKDLSAQEVRQSAGKRSRILIMHSFLRKVQACVSKLLTAFAPISKSFPQVE